MNEVMKSFTKFAPTLQKVVGLIGMLADKANIIIPLMVMYKTVTLGIAAAKGIQTMVNTGLIASESALAKASAKSSLKLLLVAGAIAAIATYLMIASPSKVVLALFGMAAALYAIGRVGEKVGVGLTVVSKSMIAIGTGAFLAGAGLAVMAAGFSLLSVEQMMGMSVALLSFGGALYVAGPALKVLAVGLMALAAGAAAAAGPLFALSIPIAIIAGSVFIAAAGIGIMGLGMATMFEAINIEKAVAFGALLVTMAMAGPLLFLAGAGLLGVGAGMLMLGAALAFIPTRDLEAIASFATGLAELNVSNIQALVSALKEVAKAMDDIPTAKAIALTATMASAEVAANAAARLAGQPRPAPAAAAATGGNNTGQPINVHVRLELDGEVLDERIVKTSTNAKSSGGALDVIAGILN